MERLFSTVTWALSTNIYEVNVRQYTPEGSFSAFSTHLPRLKQMGVDTLWFMPITPISFLHRKGSLGSYYACSDYKAVNPEFGTLTDFKSLIAAAKELGFRIMIDWVANHTGWDHVWTRSNPDFYIRNEKGVFRPPFPDWSDTIQLDYTNPGMRRAMIDCMKYWVKECGIDGYRCDMAHLVPLDFWKEARKSVDQIKPLFWLAETEEPSYHEVFDATYTWELLHTMEEYYRGDAGMNELDKVLYNYSEKFSETALRAYFTSNHDENSHSGSEYERMGESAIAFAVLCATWSNSVPLIYSGQELPLKDKRIRFFDHDPIEWTGRPALHDFYKGILNLRLTNPALRAADAQSRTYRLDTTANQSVFAFLRKNGTNEVLVLLNLSHSSTSFTIKGKLLSGIYADLYTGSQRQINNEDEHRLEGWAFRIYHR